MCGQQSLYQKVPGATTTGWEAEAAPGQIGAEEHVYGTCDSHRKNVIIRICRTCPVLMISLTASIHFNCLILTPSFFNLSFAVLRQSSLTQVGFGGNGAAGPRICCGGSTVCFWMCHASPDQYDQNHGSSKAGPARQKKNEKAERRPKHFWQLKVPTEMGWRADRRQQHAAHTSQFGYCTALEATDMCVQHTNGVLWQSERSQDISESETWNPWKPDETSSYCRTAELCVHSKSEAVWARESGGHLSLAPSCAV